MSDLIKQEAEARSKCHADHPTRRALSIDYDLVGLRGEEALADYFGVTVDLMRRPNGDGGIDTVLCLSGQNYIVDIKTFRKPLNLIVEQGKVKSHSIYVLAKYYDSMDQAFLIGWEWGAVMQRRPVRDFGYGVLNHYLDAGELRDLLELKTRQSLV